MSLLLPLCACRIIFPSIRKQHACEVRPRCSATRRHILILSTTVGGARQMAIIDRTIKVSLDGRLLRHGHGSHYRTCCQNIEPQTRLILISPNDTKPLLQTAVRALLRRVCSTGAIAYPSLPHGQTPSACIVWLIICRTRRPELTVTCTPPPKASRTGALPLPRPPPPLSIASHRQHSHRKGSRVKNGHVKTDED